MIQRILFSVFLLNFLLCIGCDQRNEVSPNSYNEATVKQLQGLFIFIESEPLKPYDKIADLKISMVDKLISLSEKSVPEVTKEILSSFIFDKNLQNVINEIKSKFPEANGVIFNDDMSSCSIIIFKK
jgi:hypothetical protein